MTKVVMDIRKDGTVLYECTNHAGDHDVCTAISTISGMLARAALRVNVEPLKYEEGNVRIYIDKAGYPTLEVFRVAEEAIKDLVKQHPEYITLKG